MRCSTIALLTSPLMFYLPKTFFRMETLGYAGPLMQVFYKLCIHHSMKHFGLFGPIFFVVGCSHSNSTGCCSQDMWGTQLNPTGFLTSFNSSCLTLQLIPWNKFKWFSFQRATFYASYLSLFGLASCLFDGVPLQSWYLAQPVRPAVV